MKLWSSKNKKRTQAEDGSWKEAIFGDGPVNVRAAFREWWFVCLMLVYALVSVLFLSHCSYPPQASETDAPSAAQPAETAETVKEPTYTQATLAYAGDLVCHMDINAEANTGSGYDYLPILEGCVPYVSDADYAFCCMETTFMDNAQITGYPMFRSPKELATGLKEAGFDFINTASNHCMDSLKNGISSTLDVLDAEGLDHIGTYRSQEEWDENHGIVVKDINGISIAFLSYTYGTNCIPITGFEYATNILFKDYMDTYADEITEVDWERLDADMEYARGLNTDLICVFDLDQGLPQLNPFARVGEKVAVTALPAAAEWTTARGLEVFGPRSFGHNVDYRPYC